MENVTRMIPAIEVHGLDVAIGTHPVLRSIDLVVTAGDTLVLVGPSGSGKSSLLRALLGFATPTAGEIRLGGRPVSTGASILVPPEARGLAIVFQDLALWPHLTVKGNLEFGLEMQGIGRSQRADRIARMLDSVGLASHAGRLPGDLSGGERQRVAVARALVLEPEAILFDEPLASLDVVLKRELLSVFHRLLAERGTAAIYVTHDLREGMALASRFAVLEAGQLVQTGSLADLERQPSTEFVRRLMESFRDPAPGAAGLPPRLTGQDGGR